MAEDVLAVLNRRTAVAAARAEAERVGLDAEALLDSASLHSRLTALDPDGPGFTQQVRDLIHQAATARGMAPGSTSGQPAAGAPPAGEAPQQWTVEDVRRSTPAETVAAGEAGLLRNLGYAPRRRR